MPGEYPNAPAPQAASSSITFTAAQARDYCQWAFGPGLLSVWSGAVGSIPEARLAKRNPNTIPFYRCNLIPQPRKTNVY